MDGEWLYLLGFLVIILLNKIYSGHQNGSIRHSSHEVQLSQQIWIKLSSVDQNKNGI